MSGRGCGMAASLPCFGASGKPLGLVSGRPRIPNMLGRPRALHQASTSLWHGGQVADPLTYSSDIKRGPRHPAPAFVVKTGGHGSWSPFLFAASTADQRPDTFTWRPPCVLAKCSTSRSMSSGRVGQSPRSSRSLAPMALTHFLSCLSGTTNSINALLVTMLSQSALTFGCSSRSVVEAGERRPSTRETCQHAVRLNGRALTPPRAGPLIRPHHDGLD